ncbi:MAG: ATP-binding protein, partial [Chlorobium sp.]|nr:ATP-binding protein [Chlorobium sp.]
MPQNASKLNETTAPLTNVALFLSATERAINRPDHLPGMITFTGPAGYGKTSAAIYSINKYRSYYVDCRDSWNRKAFLIDLCKNMGLAAAPTIAEMVDQICEQLLAFDPTTKLRRPLVIDQV